MDRWHRIQRLVPDHGSFVDQLPEDKSAERLARALDRHKPFRRFKDTLLDYPQVREDWFNFEDAAQTRLAEAWCLEHDIEVDWV